MKKITIILSIIILVLCNYKQKQDLSIPDNSIRIRVIANSNKVEDQLEKVLVKENIENNLYKKLNNTSNINDARLTINKELNSINNIVTKTLKNNNYKIKYGNNYFPEKELNGIKYKPGNYESLVVEIGEAKGENWWCVLFPPLCSIDVKKEDKDFVEYKSKVLEILNHYN